MRLPHTSLRFFVVALALVCGTLVLLPKQFSLATAEPLQETVTSNIRQITLPTKDIIYDPTTQLIYASVPSAAGARGNCIIPITPATSGLGSSVFVGSEPNKLALSDDNQHLYVGLDGSASVRRFDVATQTAGPEFMLSQDSTAFAYPYTAYDLAVAPGDSSVVAVARQIPNSTAGVAIFENGVMRPATVNDPVSSIAFAATADKIYSSQHYSSLKVMRVDNNGVSNTTSYPAELGADIQVVNNLVYGSSGRVVNATTGNLVGTFPGVDSYYSLFVVDANVGRAYYLTGIQSMNFDNITLTLKVFDINTFVQIGALRIAGVNWTPSSLIRWGANGLAFRTSGDQVFLIQTSLIPSSEPIPSTTPAPEPTPTPVFFPAYIRNVPIPGKDIVYSSSTQTLYASVPSSAGTNGNSIAMIDPVSGNVDSTVFIGSEPNKLALSANGQYLYSVLEGASAVRRFDTAAQTAGLQIPMPVLPVDLVVLYGSPQSFAVAANGSVSIYDDDTKRPDSTQQISHLINNIEASNAPDVLYGTNNDSDNIALYQLTLDSAGVRNVSTIGRFLSGYNFDMLFDNGLLYSTGGRVINPTARKVVGTFVARPPSTPYSSGYSFTRALAVDSNLNRAFFVVQRYSGGGSDSVFSLVAYDLETFLPLGSVPLPNTTGIPTKLVRWGTNGLALRTTRGSESFYPDNQIHLIQTTLVSDAVPIPTAVQFNLSETSAREYENEMSILVTRSGPLNEPSTVDYATSDLTAKAGEDYVAKSGTLTFAPGEQSKTFTLRLIPDDVYEGPNETFAVTLSNPTSSGVILGSQKTLRVTIYDEQYVPYISANYGEVSEKNEGSSDAQITVTLSNRTVQTVTASYTTVDGSALAGADYVATSGTLTFAPGETRRTITVPIIGNKRFQGNRSFSIAVTNAVNANSDGEVAVTIVDDDGTPGMRVWTIDSKTYGYLAMTFSDSSYAVTDWSTVTKIGDGLEVRPTVGQSSAPHINAPYTIGHIYELGTLPTGYYSFILRAGDALVYNTGFSVEAGQSGNYNSIDDPNWFVEAQYTDFLGRYPDGPGQQYWTNEITACEDETKRQPSESKEQCVMRKRANTSGAFFLSTEFQATGYFVYRFYKGSLGRFPLRSELTTDAQRVATGIVVNNALDFARIESNKIAFADGWLTRADFKAIYDGLSNQAYVDKLAETTGVLIDAASKDALVNGLNTGTETRAGVLKKIVDGSQLDPATGGPIFQNAYAEAFYLKEYNSAFVLMQYFGYLRRDADPEGFQFWLDKLNRSNSFIDAEMVKSFIVSAEYRSRFGQP